jgi:predicted RNA-binding Zn ribbon-like protein
MRMKTGRMKTGMTTGPMSTVPVTPEPSYAEKLPKPVAGALCLDFINTVTWRGDPTRQAERLTSYGELVIWSRLLGTINGQTERILLAKRETPAAQRVLGQALNLRHELEHLFDPASPKMIKTPTLDGLMRSMGGIGKLVPGKGWQPLGTSPDLQLPLLPVAVSALSLLTAPQKSRMRNCADPLCGWVFLDETKNQTRAWCSMEGCGNRAKARAHYARKTKENRA